MHINDPSRFLVSSLILLFALTLRLPHVLAAEHTDEFLDKYSIMAQVYYDAGLRLEKQGEYSKALTHLSTAVHSDPDNEEIHHALARVRAKLQVSMKGVDAALNPLSRIFMTTGDAKGPYRVLGVVKATDMTGNLEQLNRALRREALSRGADGLIRVHYIDYKDQLHGMATAVKLR